MGASPNAKTYSGMKRFFSRWGGDLVFLLILVGVSFTSLYNYLLFHSLAELFSIVVAFGIFLVAWNSRRFHKNHYVTFLGIAYFWVAIIDLIHTLAYKGMGVFPGYTTDLPTQLWILARYMEGVSLFLAPLFMGRRLSPSSVFLTYFSITALALVSIFFRLFPTCYIEGVGLSGFKILSEFIISAILCFSILILWPHREKFAREVFSLIIASIAVTVASELSFTLYVDVYGFFNMLGHIFKIISFYLIYQALVFTGLSHPFELLFHELSKSERLHRAEIELSPDGVVTLGHNFQVISANEQAARLFGAREASELRRKEVISLVPDQEQELLEALLETIIHKGRVLNQAIMLQENPLGRNVELSGVRINDDQGRVWVIFLILDDISERIVAEKEKTHLASFPELNPDPVLEVDASGKIVYFNQTAQRVAQGNACSGPDCFIPQDLPELFKVLKSGLVASESVEIRIGNSWFEESIHLSPGLETIRIYAKDITERKTFQELLLEKEERYRTLFHSVPDLVLHLDLDGVILDLNSSVLEVFGKEGENPIGKPFYSLSSLPEGLKVHLNQLLEMVKEQGGIIQKEVDVDFPPGEKRFYKIYLSTLRKEGKPSSILLVAHDTTEERKLEQLRADWTRSIVHDLSNPLSAITAAAELFSFKAMGEDAKSYAKIVAKNAERLERMIKSLLEVARIEAGELKLSFEEVNLAELLKRFSREQLPILEEKGLELDLDIPEDAVLVQGDKGKLEEALANLFENACKFTPRGGRITVRLERKGELADIHFSDTGRGIAREHLPHIFERFYKADKSSAGTGLGLFIVQWIVEQHGGSISVSSKVGEGTTFIVSLPLLK